MEIVIRREELAPAIEQLLVTITKGKDSDGKFVLGPNPFAYADDLRVEVERAVRDTLRLWNVSVEFEGER